MYFSQSPKSQVSAPAGEFACAGSRKHPYNTRSSAAKSNFFTRHNRSSSFNSIPPEVEALEEFNRQEMDYSCNFEGDAQPQQQQQQQQNNQSFICRIFCQLFNIVSKISVFLMIISLIMLNYDIQKLKDEIASLQFTEVKKKSDAIKDKKLINARQNFLLDPVGRPDFALESTGGRIVRTDARAYTASSRTFLGIPLCEGSHGPSAMIQVTHSPGECWAFSGETGSSVIELIDYVIIDAVTLEHIPGSISPTGSIDTAPKDFKIYGLVDPYGGKKKLLGTFEYCINGGTVQTFKINNQTAAHYKFVEFEVLSNHGNEVFTCVYRLRVHGVLGKRT